MNWGGCWGSHRQPGGVHERRVQARRHIDGSEDEFGICEIWVGDDGIGDGDNVDVPDISSGFSRAGSDVIVSFRRGVLIA